LKTSKTIFLSQKSKKHLFCWPRKCTDFKPCTRNSFLWFPFSQKS